MGKLLRRIQCQFEAADTDLIDTLVYFIDPGIWSTPSLNWDPTIIKRSKEGAANVFKKVSLTKMEA